MPIYEFRCENCGHVFEELCRFDEDGAGRKCPQCGHVGARKLISVFAAHGLENGHHGVGKKWGNTSSGSKSESSSSSSSSSAAAD